MLNRIILIILFSFSLSADLFISEVAEGSSNNKYIEIYNAGDEDVDLSAYSLSSCSNGCDVDGEWDYLNNVTFEDASIAPGDVYVVCHGSADETIQLECDQTFTYLSNGDDLFALTYLDGVVVDMVGDYGEDPGSGWDVCGVSAATKDHTLVRKSSVIAGNFGNWGISAGTDSEDCEWIVYDQNTWDYVGYHVMDAPGPDYIVEAGMFYYAPDTLTIQMGETVSWDNVNGTHDVVAYDGSFALDACQAPCTIGEVTFTESGTFDYFCSVGNHEAQGMVATIIVEGEIQLQCEDDTACNFMEDGECVYPEENYDCDGNCTAEEDCFGECGGDAVIDECGECGGNGSSCAEVANLFISEAAEGSSNNKYLEIYNASGEDVDLGPYSLSSCSNGCDIEGEWDYPNNVTFEAGTTLAAGDVYVVCHGSSDEYILAECDQTFTYLSNGDDVFALTFGEQTLDVIGTTGDDPGSGWQICDIEDATKDHTIVRKSWVGEGTSDWGASSGSDGSDCQWIVLDQNDWYYLGFHDMDDDDEGCEVNGDVNSDGILNVLDVVAIVSAITSNTTEELECADMNGDEIVNVLDIVQIVSTITGGRTFDADSASLEIHNFNATLKANGYIGGVQMRLEHDDNFDLELTNNCMVSDYVNHGNYTIVVIVEPQDEMLFTANSTFDVSEILVANSETEIKVNMMNDFSLSEAYPNPFNPSTSFNISIPSTGYLSIKVFNISGQLVDVIASGMYSPSTYNFTWNANNMATGMYVINAEFEGSSISHNVSLIK